MKYRLTRPAIRDLAGIGVFTRRQWGEKQARDYRAGMVARLRWLGHNKTLWRERKELGEGIFSYPQQSHVIVFREREGAVEVLRILHQRMEVAR